MASVAIPPPAPATPAVPTPTATAHMVTEHGPVDRMQNKLASAMASKPTVVASAAPAPAVSPAPAAPLPAIPALTPEKALEDVNRQLNQPGAIPAQVETPVVDPAAPVTPAVATEFNLDEIDFDAPIEDQPSQAAAGTPATPANIPDAQVVSELEKALLDGAVPEKIEELFLKHSRGRQMLQSFKRDRDLSKPPAEGGIGRVPDAEYIKAADQSHRTITAMLHEIEHDPISFVSNLVMINPETGTSFLGGPQQIQQFLSTLPQILFRAAQEGSNPAYAKLAAAYTQPVFSSFFNHQYQKALMMPQGTEQEKLDKSRVLDALQISEFQAFGEARPLNLGVPMQNGVPNNTPNQVNPEVAQLQARVRGYEQQIRDGQQQNFRTAVNHVQSESKTVAMGDIDRVLKLAGLDRAYPGALLQPYRDSLFNDISGALNSIDPGGWQQYQIQVKQAALGKLETAAPAKTFRILFQNALRNSPQVRDRLQELVRGAKSNSDAQITQRQESQSRTEPSGSGTPVRTSVLPSQQLARQPGEGQVEFSARRLAAASQSLVK